MQISFPAVDSQELISKLAMTADEIWHEYFPIILTEEQINYMVEKFQSEKAITDMIKNNGYQYYLVLSNELIIGYFGIKPEKEALFLSKLYLKCSYRGRGIASQMLEKITNLAKSGNHKSIYLTVNKHNSRAIAVYEAKGFERIRSQVSDIGNGFIMDDYVYEKRI